MSKVVKDGDTVKISKPEAAVIDDHDEQVVKDDKTGDTLLIPSDNATTKLTYKDGKPIPDRIVTILLSEYVNYPEDISGYVKDGNLVVNENLKTILPNSKSQANPQGKVDPQSLELVLETQVYKNEKGEVQKIIKSIPKDQYPAVKKLREMAKKA